MYLRVISLAGFLLVGACLHAEPSAFESQSGATKKDIKNLKDSSLNLSSIVIDLQKRVETLEQVQYGLQSLYDSQNQKLQKALLDIEDQSVSLRESRARMDVLKEQITQMIEMHKNLEDEQRRFVMLLNESDKRFKDLSQISSNLNAVTLKEFEALRSELKKQAEVILSSQENIRKLSLEIERLDAEGKKKKEKNAFKQTGKKSDVFKDAKKLYGDKAFGDAKARFVWLIAQGYQKAEANYYLGQIAYAQKYYEDALFYYGESAKIDDKASYMPTLLLNSAKSFEGLKNPKNALVFIQSLLENYPKSKEASEAKKIKTKLQGEKNGK